MKDLRILLAGFGGQGVLFLGKVIAYAGLMDGKEVSWLPSYGPEMRGGTANCSVCIADEPIGSPLIIHPDVFVAMNLPSYEKFVDAVEPGGTILIDSSLIPVKCEREDVTVCYIPATKLAEENGMTGLANIVMLGKLFSEIEFCTRDSLEEGIRKSVPPRKKDLTQKNIAAVNVGAAN